MITLAAVCALGAISPGPSLLVILNVAGDRGERAGIMAAWAHALGVGLWAALSLAIWQTVLTRASWLVDYISMIAAIYLLYLAAILLLDVIKKRRDPQVLNNRRSDQSSPISESEIEEGSTQLRSSQQAALAGLSIAIANPKLMIFFSTIYPQVIPEHLSDFGYLIAVFIPLLIDGSWYHLVVSTASRAGLLPALSDKRWITHLCTAILFIYIAAQALIG